ncbi:transcription antitermination regulator [Kitasatospora herbaricolor]|uniref:Transcription antitermination regulator n=1 Tax=Kitasatospora indigofera TaxID=67307 RepID=A0A918YUR0_9ACTN|nr:MULTISPECIES: SpoIIE family protein phosphatase [Kitasatospora]MDQ0305851.1 serine phosphatase RsbU (regulator of sigma subunit) [Kitasatospora herbaricolor]GGV51666.1 transcription antitermination regulator [Kitasatospora herbaricolor]GHE25345.1 transcription antitermination regulator [Kitasatospora indigofera]
MSDPQQPPCADQTEDSDGAPVLPPFRAVGRSEAPADAGVVGRLTSTVERLSRELAQARAEADGRALVELAKGILVERLGYGPADASRQLEDLAAQSNVSVLELAADLVNQASHDRIADVARDFVATAAEPSLGLRLRSAETGMLIADDVQAVAQSVLEHALRPLGAQAVAIWSANADQSLTLAGSAGFGEQEARLWRHVPPGVPTPARRALTERAATAYDSPDAARLPSIGQRDITGGRLAVPAGVGGRITGVLEICWPNGLPPQSQSLQRQFETLAELCATALESRPAGDTDPAAAPQTAELLELIHGLPDPCMVLQPVFDTAHLPTDYLIKHVNPRFVDFAGRPRTAILGARLMEAYPLAAESGGLFEKIEHVLATGEPFRSPAMHLAALVDGVPLATEAAVNISRHGTQVVVHWRTMDGTARVASLLQHAQRLGRIGGFEQNLRSGEIAWNDTLFDLYGLAHTADPISIEHLAAHAHADDEHTIGRFLRTLLHHQRPASTAFRLKRADGIARHIRVVAEPVLNQDGRLTAIRGAYQDVSSQHWTEVALAATRDQLAQTEQQSAERSRLALQLQHAIMPPSRGPLELHDLRVAVRYRPAEKEHLVGGDWYDTVDLPSGHVLLCVGDVAGHGIDAATGMVALRNALRGLAATGAGPAQLLSWLNSVTHHLTENVTATAVCALYEPGTRLLRWARAGHLPPLLLRDESAIHLTPISGILLGALDQADYEEGEIELQSGDTLMLYTDGLIERKDRSLQASLDHLRITAQAHAPSRSDAVAELEHRLDHLLRHSSADTDDDTCLIGITVQ